MFSLRFLKAAIGAIAANSHFVRGNDHGGSGEIGLVGRTSGLQWHGSCRLFQSFPDNLLLADFKDRRGIVSVVAVAKGVR
jgi:hypothetical protein